MLPCIEKYKVYPSVYPADKEVDVTIIPTGRVHLFREDVEYKLTVTTVDCDFYGDNAGNQVEYTVKGEGGVLKFKHTVPGEGEHVIFLHFDPEKPPFPLYTYSLFEDLYKLRPMKGDLHSHSFRSDGLHDPVAIAGHFREQGYDFAVLSDHNRYYPSEEMIEGYNGVKLGFTPIRGEEVHAPGGSVLHVVHAGGRGSVTEMYMKNLEGFEKEIKVYEENLAGSVPDRYLGRYARSKWITDKVKEVGGIAIYAHPYWRPGQRKLYSTTDELAEIHLKSGFFDAYELVGGMGQIGNNRSLALWNKLTAEGLKISVVGSSDIHHIAPDSTFMYIYTVAFAEDRDADSIIDAVKAGRCVAVEATGEEPKCQYRCYGDFRYVSYAHFLLKYFFPELQRVCQNEGVLMYQYSMGEADPKLIELLAEHTEHWRSRFFGIEPPILPSKEILDFEDKWRAVQLDGPKTKGGSAFSDVVSMQI